MFEDDIDEKDGEVDLSQSLLNETEDGQDEDMRSSLLSTLKVKIKKSKKKKKKDRKSEGF